jgi:transcription elongation GreA/GreB family factor
MQKDVILTPEGLEKLKQEIEHLSVTRRREVAERIKEAREFGDISENSSTTTRRTSRRCSNRGSPSSRTSSARRR